MRGLDSVGNGQTMLMNHPAETRDGKKYYDEGPKSPEMQRLNASFGKLHGISSALNLLGTFAMIYYGATLAELL